MSPAYSAIVLVVLVVALIGHYLSQKSLLAKGWLAVDPQPQIKRLGANGAVLFVVAIVALMTADFPIGLIGILLFIEAAVCVAFARKLRNK
jgi:hypothetical protein